MLTYLYIYSNIKPCSLINSLVMSGPFASRSIHDWMLKETNKWITVISENKLNDLAEHVEEDLPQDLL